jgi:hypothetical protein
MSETPFAAFSDEELCDLAAAMDSAYGEGAFGNGRLAQLLVDEATLRDLKLSCAYSRKPVEAADWLEGMNL